jgi:hypothetical protein
MQMATEAATNGGQPSAEMIQKLTEFANKLVWKQPDLNVLRPEFSGQYPLVAETIQEHIKRSHHRNRLVLPDLRAFKPERCDLQRLWR